MIWKVDNLDKITYPTHNEGRLCGYDLPTHPYVYYTTTTDPVLPALSRPNVSASTSAPRRVRHN